MFQPGAVVNTQGFGNRPENVEVPHYDVRAPAATDILYPLGKMWICPALGIYCLQSQSSNPTGTVSVWVKFTTTAV